MKKFTFILLGLLLAIGASAQDIKKKVVKATAQSEQPGEGIGLAIDGNKKTFWHSSWGGVTFPQEVTIEFAQVEHVDYVRYTPRPGGGNGDWGDVTLSYHDGSKYVAVGDFSLGMKGTAYDFEMPEGGVDTKKFRFTIKSAHGNFTSAAELESFERSFAKRDAFAAVFKDRLCLELKDGITSSEGIEDPDVKQLVDNLLGSAADVEKYKKFRVGEYEPYMTVETLNSIMKNSSVYNQFENPTGIYLKEGESCAVMVDGITDYPVGLKIKNGILNLDHSTYTLQNGYNYITAANEGNVFVSYYTDDYKNAPNVKVHLVNAPVRGYWDKETMTNDDWKEMLANCPNDSSVIIVRSKYAQLFHAVCAWKRYCPENVDSVMTLYQQVQEGEREMMGLFKYGYDIKNRLAIHNMKGGALYASWDGAWMGIDNMFDQLSPDANNYSFWAVGHEWGHCNQIEGFKWSGLGETSNNVYSSWVQFKYTANPNRLTLEDEYTGVNDYAGMRGGRMQTYFEEGLRKGVNWQMMDGPDYHGDADKMVEVQDEDENGNKLGIVKTPSRNFDHFVKLVPFWQMNLWGTVAGKSPDIIPMILQSLRTTPNYTQTYNTVGKQQINWMKLACDSAHVNLLPFFEKAGMLKPMHRFIEDYGKGWSIITEKMINDLKAHVEAQGYPTPTEEINYINGHNYHIYRDSLPLEVPATLGEGCELSNQKYVTVQHSAVKNAVAYETYNANDELIRITMYGLGADEEHTYTQVLYPASTNPEKAAAYIVAVGYDGTRKKIYEHTNIREKVLSDNGYYRITSNGRGNALSCGAQTSADEKGAIKWNLARGAKSDAAIDQIWQWQMVDEDSYKLYNPQSGCYFAKKGGDGESQLFAGEEAQNWEVETVDKAKNTYVLKIQDSGNYLNAFSDTKTGYWGGGASDGNNIWTIEPVTAVSLTMPAAKYANVCYPFAVQLPEELTAYVVSAVGADYYEGEKFDYALLEELGSNVVPARMPVILGGKKGSYDLAITEEPAGQAEVTNLLHGSTLRVSRDKGTFLSAVSSTSEAGTSGVIKTNTATSVAANKAYLLKTQAGGLDQLYLGLKSLHDGIGDVRAEKSGFMFHDLNGAEAGKLQKGHIYITPAGKKILVK